MRVAVTFILVAVDSRPSCSPLSSSCTSSSRSVGHLDGSSRTSSASSGARSPTRSEPSWARSSPRSVIPLTSAPSSSGAGRPRGHFGRAIQRRVRDTRRCLYRIASATQLRLFGLGPLTEGFEQRMPEVVAPPPARQARRTRRTVRRVQDRRLTRMGAARAPSSTSPSPTPSSAPPSSARASATVGRSRHQDLLHQDGSSLPQIVRESRALDAAKPARARPRPRPHARALLLRHALRARRVPRTRHAAAATPIARPAGLDNASLPRPGYAADLLHARSTPTTRAGSGTRTSSPTTSSSTTTRAHLVDLRARHAAPLGDDPHHPRHRVLPRPEMVRHGPPGREASTRSTAPSSTSTPPARCCTPWSRTPSPPTAA
jgi:hypothetical protein